MIKYLLLTVLLSFGVAEANAQKVYGATEFSFILAQKMKDSLQLDQVEYEKVLATNVQLQSELAEIHADKTNTRQELQRKLITLEKGRDERYEKILNSEKYSLYLSKKNNLFKIN